MLVLTLIYAFAGLFGRDPWKNDDAEGFGAMWTLAHGHFIDWILPHIAGREDIAGAPLPYWLGAFSMKIFGDLIGEPNAARLIAAVCFIGTAATIWYATYLLGRRPEVQPMEFAFGGQPSSKEYGRTLADGALLIFLACVGLAQRAHETSPMLVELFGVSFLLYGVIRGLDKPWQGGILAGVGLIVVSLSGMLWACVFLGLGTLTAFMICQTKIQWRWLLMTLLVLICGLLVWPILWEIAGLSDAQKQQAVITWWGRDELQPSISIDSIKFLSINFWLYAWPIWPLSVWSIYHWGKKGLKGWRAAHLAIPGLIFLSELFLLLFVKDLSERYLMTLMPPLAILAAFALPFLKRGFISFIDWLAMISFTIIGGFIWVIWVAKMTGFPKTTADNVARLLPGFVGHFSWWEFLSALVITGLWILVIRWRTSRAPKMIWRCVIISAAGTTLMWVLLMTLWLPTIDYAKTYRHVANRFAMAVPKNVQCIDTTLLGDAQLASFAYFTKLPLRDDPSCELLITHSSLEVSKKGLLANKQLTLIWEDRRDIDRDERLHLYRVSESTPSTVNP